ncbi:MAG TPA: multiheme c-type cytochrome, partial [Polyangiaceae bacterium]|nr:multiheme c-type cytochrome [Polyangiaceae bacterium]
MTRLGRKRNFLERHWPWFLLAFGASGALFVLGAAVDLGLLASIEAFGSILRGYTTSGVVLGIASVVLALMSFAYAFRKRGFQEHWPLGRSTLAAWLWGHVYFGLLAVVAAGVHAGYGALSFQVSTGKLLFGVFLMLIGSGLLWRLLYAAVPPGAARDLGNYSQLASRARAEACLVEIEKIAAGRSPRFRELTSGVLTATPSPTALAQALSSLVPDDQASFSELATLAATRHDAIARERKQGRALRLLQGLRIIHVPVSLLFLLLIPLHVVFAFDLPATTLESGAFGGSALGGFEPATACSSCHAAIYEEWRHSMHAHAMTSPVMIAQTNQVATRILADAKNPDPKRVCVTCHGPVGVLLSEGNTLPLPEQPASDRALLDDGISCAVCHQWQGESHTGGAGLSRFLDGLEAGRTYFGPIATPVGNAFHKSERGAVFQKPAELCRNCHSVQYDKNGDGRFDRGVDLVLQTLYDEWEVYAQSGGAASCLDCHMPVKGKGRAADGASVPFEQDQDAPQRLLHDHSFVAVDYPLDLPKAREATRSRREGLLRRAASVAVPKEKISSKPGSLAFSVDITNSGTGHNLPGGFAFVRQMWFEVVVKDRSGRVLAQSGVLEDVANDLCDSSILDDRENPMRPFVVGCRRSDPLLVNFQQQLVDRVAIARDVSGNAKVGVRGENLLEPARGAREVVLQFLDAGPVPRLRPATKKPTVPLVPGETATFPYTFTFAPDAAPARLTVRLLLRVAPPYFLRA